MTIKYCTVIEAFPPCIWNSLYTTTFKSVNIVGRLRLALLNKTATSMKYMIPQWWSSIPDWLVDCGRHLLFRCRRSHYRSARVVRLVRGGQPVQLAYDGLANRGEQNESETSRTWRTKQNQDAQVISIFYFYNAKSI